MGKGVCVCEGASGEWEEQRCVCDGVLGRV